MNINFTNLLLQCAALGVWVFICAGLYAIWEKFADRFLPGFLDIEEEGASQAPMMAPAQTDAAEKKA
jgi:hypothetical protein